jgi:hypothetical protein
MDAGAFGEVLDSQHLVYAALAGVDMGRGQSWYWDRLADSPSDL